jgi:LysR family transcriptional regulator for metE and metH
MEVRHLRLVQAVTQAGSLAAASQELHLTASALSHQLKEVEDQLGTPLFLRVGKRLVLTPAGQRVRALADEVLTKLDAVEADLRDEAAGEAGRIRVSTGCYTSYHWLPATVRHFRTFHPQVEIRLVLEATHAPLEALVAGDLDAAITCDPVENGHLVFHELFHDEMVALVPADHPWAGRPHVFPADFATETLIIHSLPLESVTVIEAFLKPAGQKPREITVLPLTEAQLALVKAGLGVTVMARWALGPALRDRELKTVRLGPDGLHRTHYLAVLRDAPPPALEALLTSLRQERPGRRN